MSKSSNNSKDSKESDGITFTVNEEDSVQETLDSAIEIYYNNKQELDIKAYMFVAIDSEGQISFIAHDAENYAQLVGQLDYIKQEINIQRMLVNGRLQQLTDHVVQGVATSDKINATESSGLDEQDIEAAELEQFEDEVEYYARKTKVKKDKTIIH